MQKINFSASINAPREKVWKVLWDDSTYRQWTSPFCEGSYAVTDNWKEGTKVLFLSPDGRGMVSTVAANRENEYMSFQHLGEVKDGVEDITSEKVKGWAGALENYTLKEANSKTDLFVELDITDEHKDYFITTWPKAIEKIKEIAEAAAKVAITVEAIINVPVEKVWNCWTAPEHIVNWCHASDDWHAPHAENDLQTGGKFKTVMAAKDGSFSFDFEGVYTEVSEHKIINYTITDGRKVEITFISQGDKTAVTETFEAENMHPLEVQRDGWLAILDNFKKYTEVIE